MKSMLRSETNRPCLRCGTPPSISLEILPILYRLKTQENTLHRLFLKVTYALENNLPSEQKVHVRKRYSICYELLGPPGTISLYIII